MPKKRKIIIFWFILFVGLLLLAGDIVIYLVIRKISLVSVFLFLFIIATAFYYRYHHVRRE